VASKFQLAEEVLLGEYTLRAKLGETSQKRKVKVKRYILPKFKINFTPEKKYYLPGEVLKGRVKAEYFFGKPVADGKVIIDIASFDVKFNQIALLEGKTNQEGIWNFEVKLPEYFVGQPLEQGNAFVKVEVNVVDKAEHREKLTTSIPIAKSPIKIIALPESGELVPGVKNVIYLVTSYPHGEPAQTRLRVNGGKPFNTDKLGIGKWSIQPQEEVIKLGIEAEDKFGNKSLTQITLSCKASQPGILLRTNKAVYKVGEQATVVIFSSQKEGEVYLDIIKNRQTVLTQSLTLKGARGVTEIVLSEELTGMLLLHAYLIPPSGEIIRDTRIVYVEPAKDLLISVKKNKPTWRPGEEAIINFEVTTQKGKPVVTALGIRIVDESVYALGELQPGLEKVYFRLEEEILKPKYEIHAFSLPEVVILPRKPQLEMPSQQRVANVLFANFTPEVDYSLRVNSYQKRLEKMRKALQKLLERDYQKIKIAITKHYQRYPKISLKETGLKELIKEGFLTLKELYDPWGREYLVKPCGCSQGYRCSFTLRSVGRDGIKGTEDDIFYPAPVKKLPRVAEVLRVNFLGEGLKREVPLPLVEAKKELPVKESVSQKPIRVRQFFPETLFVEPSLITTRKGKAKLTLPLADTITTWRLTVLGSSKQGQLGSTTSKLRVFQDFFIDLDLPPALTQGDEFSLPVAVYNYLPTPQKVQIKLEKADWFLLKHKPEQELWVKPNEVTVVYFDLKINKLSHQKLTVYAYGSKFSDAITKEVTVVPNGEEKRIAINGKLEGTIKKEITIPSEAIDDASNILVKLYPGVFSQVVEGLDKIFRMPFGCFEQTSSITYPNVLVLDYIKKTKMVTPELEMKARQFINLGYQRLLTFEVPGGGFSWFGTPPANQILSAYGLLEFTDIKRVHPIDENLIKRTRQWLLSKQLPEGKWEPDKEYLHPESWGKIQNSALPVTGYITWALAESGARKSSLKRAISYLRKHIGETNEPYILALCANAFLSAGEEAKEVLARLVDLRKETEKHVWWETSLSTITHTRDKIAHLETTALAVYALLKAGEFPNLVSKALSFLISAKDSYGTWFSTQATVLALKALILSLEQKATQIEGEVAIKINGQEATRFKVTKETSDIMRLVDLKKWVKEGKNRIQIEFQGKGSTFYQIVAKYYLPWQKKPRPEALSIKIEYSRQELTIRDIISAKVKIKNLLSRRAKMIIIDLGIPPGFQVLTDDFAKLVSQGKIERYSVTARGIIVYLDQLAPQETLEFSYRLKARMPLRAKSLSSRVYEYYNPENKAEAQPVEFLVKE
jgi:uncharacterized protein YfaS (alpha-2-macroglobulin family)